MKQLFEKTAGPDYGVMLGFIKCEDDSERPIALYGHVEELTAVARIVGLQIDANQIAELESGKAVHSIYLSDGYGSHATMQPVNDASEFLQRVRFHSGM